MFLPGVAQEAIKAQQELLELIESDRENSPMNMKEGSPMTRDEIFARFEKYDFRDKKGHPLTGCLEFQLLVDQIISDAEQTKRLENYLMQLRERKS